jgi:hypothetical protein
MARVLVEVDIHAGLLEILDIEWRGHLFAQRLDYLGYHSAVRFVEELDIYARIVSRLME